MKKIANKLDNFKACKFLPDEFNAYRDSYGEIMSFFAWGVGVHTHTYY